MEPTAVEHFSIKTDAFEGPLELLLDLVEKRKFLINDISLANVTDEYMEHLRVMQALSLPNTAHFVALAATLLLIKSKSLLPVLTLTEEETESVDDLERRLQHYKIFRDAAMSIHQCFGQNIMYERQYVRDTTPLFLTDHYTTTEQLTKAIGDVLLDLPITDKKPTVQVRKVISLEEMMTRLQERIENSLKLTLRELLEDSQEKTHVVVGFLAVLESVKQGSILVAQANRFEEIHIEREGSSTPRYY